MEQQKSSDGTILLSFEEGYKSVIIPSKDNKNAVCVSCQIGCPMSCAFCRASEFVKDLSVDEILAQVRTAAGVCGSVTSIVFMGMGEPMLNYHAVKIAIECIHKEFSIGYRHITLSTCGIGLDKLINVPFHVAISLHGSNDEIRNKLVGGTFSANDKKQMHASRAKSGQISRESGDNKTEGSDSTEQTLRPATVAEIVAFSKVYGVQHKDGLMIEYALISGVNDSDSCLDELLSLDWHPNTNFNLIEFNDIGKFKKSTRMNLWKERIINSGFKCFKRLSRGADIEAACGMLKKE